MLRYIKNWVLGILTPDFPDCSPEEISEVTRRLFGSCPVCDGGLDGHHYWVLASAIIDEASESPATLDKLVRNGNWAQANLITEFRYDADAYEYNIVRCPNDQRLGLVVIVFTFEWLLPDFVERTALVDSHAVKALLALAGDQWVPFD